MATILGYDNWIDLATLSGGSWEADYPLTNIQTRYHGQRARSTGTSATLTVTLPSAQAIGAVGVCGNLSDAATLRVQGGTFDSGVLTTRAMPVLPAETASVWTLTVDDPGNFYGYVALGRVFIGPAFAPALNINWGASLGLESRAIVQESLAGIEFFERHRPRRVWKGQWSWLTATEAYDGLYAIQRRHDVTEEVCLIEESADPTHLGQRSFVGRFRTLSAIEWPYVDQYGMGVEIAESLG